jgi:hypothetical protein
MNGLYNSSHDNVSLSVEVHSAGLVLGRSGVQNTMAFHL